MEQNNGMTAEEVIFSNMTQVEALTRLLIKKALSQKMNCKLNIQS